MVAVCNSVSTQSCNTPSVVCPTRPQHAVAFLPTRPACPLPMPCMGFVMFLPTRASPWEVRGAAIEGAVWRRKLDYVRGAHIRHHGDICCMQRTREHLAAFSLSPPRTRMHCRRGSCPSKTYAPLAEVNLSVLMLQSPNLIMNPLLGTAQLQ